MQPDRIVLAIDTSAAHCAAALLWGHRESELTETRRTAAAVERMDKGQAERLVPMIEELMTREGATWPRITAIAVGIGPGNFTGIRIGVSFARGLALGRNIPAIGVTGFDAIAAASGQPSPFWAVIDAPRGQAYAQRYAAIPSEAQIIPATEIDTLDAPVIRQSSLSTEHLITAVAEVAFRRSATPQPRPAPFYMRGADAAPPRDPAPVILP